MESTRGDEMSSKPIHCVYSMIPRFITSVILFAVVLLLSSCGELEWETVAVAKGEDYCVSARSLMSGVWNRPVLEILLHDDCGELEKGEQLVRMHGHDRDARIEILDGSVVVASTFSNSDDWVKTYFVLSCANPPGNSIEFDYRDESENLKIVAADSIDPLWFEVYELEDKKQTRVLAIHWKDMDTSIDSRVFFLNSEDGRFHMTNSGEVRCSIMWHGAKSATTFLITPPTSRGGFIDFRVL